MLTADLTAFFGEENALDARVSPMADFSSGLNTFRSFIYTKMHLHVVEDVFETVLTADLTGFF